MNEFNRRVHYSREATKVTIPPGANKLVCIKKDEKGCRATSLPLGKVRELGLGMKVTLVELDHLLPRRINHRTRRRLSIVTVATSCRNELAATSGDHRVTRWVDGSSVNMPRRPHSEPYRITADTSPDFCTQETYWTFTLSEENARSSEASWQRRPLGEISDSSTSEYVMIQNNTNGCLCSIPPELSPRHSEVCARLHTPSKLPSCLLSNPIRAPRSIFEWAAKTSNRMLMRHQGVPSHKENQQVDGNSSAEIASTVLIMLIAWLVSREEAALPSSITPSMQSMLSWPMNLYSPLTYSSFALFTPGSGAGSVRMVRRMFMAYVFLQKRKGENVSGAEAARSGVAIAVHHLQAPAAETSPSRGTTDADYYWPSQRCGPYRPEIYQARVGSNHGTVASRIGLRKKVRKVFSNRGASRRPNFLKRQKSGETSTEYLGNNFLDAKHLRGNSLVGRRLTSSLLSADEGSAIAAQRQHPTRFPHEKIRMTPLGFELGSPWWKASKLTTPRYRRMKYTSAFVAVCCSEAGWVRWRLHLSVCLSVRPSVHSSIHPPTHPQNILLKLISNSMPLAKVQGFCQRAAKLLTHPINLYPNPYHITTPKLRTNHHARSLTTSLIHYIKNFNIICESPRPIYECIKEELHTHIHVYILTQCGAAVAERLSCSPPTIATGFNPRPGSLWDLRMGIVPDDAAGRQIFLGISRFPRPFIPALLHTHLNHSHWLSRPRC
ncbi:hypothetical protein PR048_015045 [Dryococelus australis]|uniref:Uncharacterized protein n=1 Tax=Dryococelus australis TaxID=614101 RepID=A0ABQ9HG09_9NEOP|nr:hypothetical protein PR048_015045 [Dryococelus australis]